MRANAKRQFRLFKKRSWMEFAASIDRPISCSVMWGQIRKLKGHSQSFTIQFLTEQNHIYTTHEEINELLASTYTKLSDNANYDPHQTSSRVVPIDFSLNPPHAFPQDYKPPIT